ncbi:SixA phosphatase family protein [Microvirga pudoricolor]|uniref:SixA phosphatase family protein n=1 Tax=Microvirga pudoricolor TaxID=2778729 RepID=UPI001950FF5B|nr:histidine phosphatase family protein [Microvirga pudoricolor]MBM6594471.1 histidine phosphatase family protein [Microvirga pudoricolor]
MPRLLVLRHAKAANPSGVMDIDRPLAPRGREAAALMGKYIHEEGLAPDLVLVSPSHRTRETWHLAQPPLGDVTVRFEPAIYAAPALLLLTVLQEITTPAKTVLLVGHNPGCEELVQALAGSGDGDGLQRLRTKFPTAALAVIDFDGESWADLRAGEGRLERFVTPAQLDGGSDD